jgi:hypothetical protein
MFQTVKYRSRDHSSISFSISFPTKALLETAKCRQINRFQSFIQSFPSFGRGFDSHRPLQILKDLRSRAVFQFFQNYNFVAKLHGKFVVERNLSGAPVRQGR